MKCALILFLVLLSFTLSGYVKVGADILFEEAHLDLLKGKKIGIITNHSALNHDLKTTFDLLKAHQQEYTIVSVFAPEHGFHGSSYAYEAVEDETIDEIPLYGLFGTRRRPTQEMLSQLNLLIYDVQDIGTRSYTMCRLFFTAWKKQPRAPLLSSFLIVQILWAALLSMDLFSRTNGALF